VTTKLAFSFDQKVMISRVKLEIHKKNVSCSEVSVKVLMNVKKKFLPIGISHQL